MADNYTLTFEKEMILRGNPPVRYVVYSIAERGEAKSLDVERRLDEETEEKMARDRTFIIQELLRLTQVFEDR